MYPLATEKEIKWELKKYSEQNNDPYVNLLLHICNTCKIVHADVF